MIAYNKKTKTTRMEPLVSYPSMPQSVNLLLFFIFYYLIKIKPIYLI
jgi:hypothetical protein